MSLRDLCDRACHYISDYLEIKSYFEICMTRKSRYNFSLYNIFANSDIRLYIYIYIYIHTYSLYMYTCMHVINDNRNGTEDGTETARSVKPDRLKPSMARESRVLGVELYQSCPCPVFYFRAGIFLSNGAAKSRHV